MSAFQEYYVDTLTHRYADFKGRASRSEYWYFTLFHLLVVILLLRFFLGSNTLFNIICGVYYFGSIIPQLALTVRRLHDIGNSGWFFLVSFIPIIGPILMLVWSLTDSQPGVNQWGPNPWGIGVENESDLLEHLVDEF